jgi:hypothetical protein
MKNICNMYTRNQQSKKHLAEVLDKDVAFHSSTSS